MENIKYSFPKTDIVIKEKTLHINYKNIFKTNLISKNTIPKRQAKFNPI